MSVGSTTSSTSTPSVAQTLAGLLGSTGSTTSSTSSSSSSSTGSPISFGGLATGLPANIVDMLMQSQQGQLTAMQTSKTNLTNEKAIYSSLQSKLVTLDTQITALQKASTWAPHTVSSSDSSLVSATGTDAATPGNHTVDVVQLAQNDTWVLDAGVKSVTDTLTAGSDITFTYNGVTYGTDAKAADGTTPAPTTGFDAASLTGKSLTDVAAAINNISYKDASGASQPGVSASVMYDGSSYRLVLTANDSGKYNDGTSDQSRIGIGTGTSMTFASGAAMTSTNIQNTVVGQNAIFKLDGIPVTSTTNSPSNVLTGITLQLNATTGATQDATTGAITPGSKSVIINVANDTATVKTTLNNFVTAYNGVLDFITSNNDALSASSLARMTVSQMRTVLGGRTSKAGATSATDYLPRSTLAEYGLTTDSKTGDISFNSTTLDKALQSDYSGLSSLFTNTQSAVGTGHNPGLAYRFQTLLDGMTNSTGSFTAQANGIQTRMDSLDKDITQESARLDKVKQQLTLKFSNLEQMVSKLNSAGSAMTAALSKM